LLPERPGDRRVMGDHAVDLPVPGDDEFEPQPEAMQRRMSGAEEAHARRGHPQASRLVVVLDRLERDVVAEPLRLLVRVGVAADVDEQRRVVDDRSVLLVEAETLRDAQRDQALAQDVLHWLTEPEIDPERERADELRQPDLSPIRLCGHTDGHRDEPYDDARRNRRTGPVALARVQG